jgi:pyruvate/2-oxoglutarate dehydrogenase complex dihydrolipoamide dehydrogenase (E3) component
MITGKKELSQLATNGVIQGKIVGKNILGKKEKYQGHTMAMIFQFLGEEFGQVGLNPKKAKLEGIDYVEGVSHSTDIYKDLSGVHNVLVKILFNKKNKRVIGATAYGKNLVWIINLISFAISKKSTIEDLMKFDYASHPSLSPWPFMDPIVDASENAYNKILK